MSGTDLVRRSDLIKQTKVLGHLEQHGSVDTGKMDPSDFAREREKYEKSSRPEDKRVAAAYKALEDGRQMVQMSQVFDQTRQKGMFPGLALVRGDFSSVVCEIRQSGLATFSNKRWRREVPDCVEAWTRAPGTSAKRTARAKAPHVPPDVREAFPNLREYLLVWEPEWKMDPVLVRMPRDPALLEHVVGDLYVVVASWDLTPLEIAALGG